MTWEGVPHDHDTCPTCGPLHVTTDSTCGRTLAIRVDGKGLCTCTFEQSEGAGGGGTRRHRHHHPGRGGDPPSHGARPERASGCPSWTTSRPERPEGLTG